MAKGVTAAVLIDRRSRFKDGTHPLKLRLIFQRKSRLYPITRHGEGQNVSISGEDWEAVNAPKQKGRHKQLLNEIRAIEVKARGIIAEIQTFSFDAFRKRWSQKATGGDVFAAYRAAVVKYNEAGQIGTRRSYQNSLASLERFARRNVLNYAEVTPDFLAKYERWMLQRDCSPSTIGIYLRPLRAIFNEGIRAGAVDSSAYPFGRGLYVIPTSKNTKKALTLEEIGLVANYQTDSEARQRARDLFMFSYYTNGANFKDICKLKWTDIDGDMIYFVRAKTKRTQREQKQIAAPLLPEAKKIVERWGNENKEGFVFPFLNDCKTAEDRHRAIYNIRRVIINRINDIAADVGINKRITTYWARHTFATVLKRSGAPTAFISESVGHADEATTQRYLDSFEDDEKARWAKVLTGFKQKRAD